MALADITLETNRTIARRKLFSLGIPALILVYLSYVAFAFDVAGLAGDYLAATAAGLPALLFYRAFYAFNNAVGRPRALMAISAIVTSVHLPLAWALTNGAAGLPELGGAGCGVSTAIINWLALLCGLTYLVRNRAYRQYHLFSRWRPPHPGELGKLLRLGLPMGLSTFIDISSFTLIAILVARLGVETVAGHRVISNFTGVIYMLPLALSIATMVLVGQAVGANDPARARLTARVGMGLTGGLAVLLGAALWLLREPLVALSTTDPAVQAVALGLVLYLCFYQGFDGLQTVAAHALRGYKVTLLPMLLHTFCFWGIGLSGGYWLSFHAPWRAGAPSVAGFWEGCVLATLAATAEAWPAPAALLKAMPPPPEPLMIEYRHQKPSAEQLRRKDEIVQSLAHTLAEKSAALAATQRPSLYQQFLNRRQQLAESAKNERNSSSYIEIQ